MEIFHNQSGSTSEPAEIQRHVLWDRKAEGGFPETKELKRRVRDIIDPTRNLGHVDGYSKAVSSPTSANSAYISSSSSSTHQLHTATPRTATEGPAAEVAIPKAINRLQGGEGQALGLGERKFTPMDVDIKSRPTSRGGDGEVVNERGKVVIGSEDRVGFCIPGGGDCG